MLRNERLPSRLDSFPKKKIAFNIGPASHIVKRKKPLKKIYDLLHQPELEYPSVTILGNPKSGKTELAKQYARNYQKHYHHRWLVHASTWESDYRELAKEWKLSVWNSPSISEVVREVHKVFEYEKDKRSLIIFDNVSPDFAAKIFGENPMQNTDVIFTSKIRDATWSSNSIDLNADADKEFHLEEDEGITILKSWIGDEVVESHRNKALTIVRRFHNLPLLLAQVGYIVKSPHNLVDLENFIDRFQENRAIVSHSKVEDVESGDYIDTYAILEETMNNVKKENPEALKLLEYCAHLPSQNIPEELMLSLFNGDKELLESALEAASVVVTRDSKTLTLHDEIASIVVDINKSSRDVRLRELSRVCTIYPEFILSDPQKGAAIFARAFEEEEQKTSPDHLRLIELATYAGDAYYSQGNREGWGLSEQYYRKALEYARMLHGEDHIETARCLNKLGKSLNKLTRNSEAFDCHDQALENFLIKYPDKNHPDVSKSLRRKGVALTDLTEIEAIEKRFSGKVQALEEGIKCKREAYKIDKRFFGKFHFLTLRNLTQMAVTLGDWGREIVENDPVKAKKFFDEALKRSIKALDLVKRLYPSQETLHHASVYNLLGYAYSSLAKIENARENFQFSYDYYLLARDIRERVLLNPHEDLPISYNNTAKALYNLEQYGPALDDYNEALVHFLQVYSGKEHRNVGRTQVSMALTKEKLGYYSDAALELGNACIYLAALPGVGIDYLRKDLEDLLRCLNKREVPQGLKISIKNNVLRGCGAQLSDAPEMLAAIQSV